MIEARQTAVSRLTVALGGAALLILLGTIILSYLDWREFRQATAETEQAREVLELTDELLSSLKDAETGQRGYVLTGEREYLQPYEQALRDIPNELQRLSARSGRHSLPTVRIKLIEDLVAEKAGELKKTIEINDSQSQAAAVAIIKTDAGMRSMEQLRQLCGQIRNAEYASLVEHSHAMEVHGQRTRLFTAFGSAILFTFLLGAGFVIASASSKRERLIGQLETQEREIAEVRDLLQTTLSSIGDAVIATDVQGKITFMNPVAEALTGSAQERALGRPLDQVFRIINESTHEPVENPVAKVLREGTIVGLANHTVLISATGTETPIDDSGAPIRGTNGAVIGVVMVFRDITERKQAEQESLRLAAIVDSSDDAIISQGLDGIILTWNAAAERLFGYVAPEIVGRDFSLLIPKESQEDQQSVLERIRRNDPGIHYDVMRRCKDGSLVEVSVSVSPIRNAEGKVVGISRIGRNITERRLAEEALRRSNQQTVDILESIRDGFVALDRDWTFTYVNAEAEKILGKPRAALIGKAYWQVYPEVIGTATDARLRHAAAELVAVTFEEFYAQLGGWFEVSLYPAAEGGLSIYFRNVTERKNTLEALRISEERLRISAEAAQIGVWNNDLIARRVTWSPELERLFGLAPGSFRGTNEHAAQLLHPDDRERALEVINNAAECRIDFDVECRIVRPDGEIRWIFVRGRPRYGVQGEAVSMAGVAIDVTSRRRLEEKMRQAQKLESLGVLAGGIAHDFNNLLVGIMGNAGILMEETPPDAPSRDVIENLMAASERAAHLTRQMLAYSGRGRFVVERLQLDQQIRQIVTLIAASIPKGVKLDFDFERNLPPIEADAGQLQQLVMNLVINGAEAIGDGGGTVTISTKVRDIGRDYVKDNLAGDNIPPGSYLVLEVHDTGMGMDAETQAKIFDPFFTTKFTGRGLGLAAALGIVRGHKGALTVYSEPGQGTTFKVFLPAASAAGRQTEAGSAPVAEFHGEGTVLIVDDEPVIQRTLKMALERYGYSVLTASGGEEATAEVAKMDARVDLVLLDMTMPVVSGEETLRRLRAIRPDIPVIATSGYNEIEAIRRFGAGISGFIQKPFTPRKLAEQIKGVLEKTAKSIREN